MIQLPYAEIKEPFQAYWDLKHNRSRIDYYGQTVITILKAGSGVPGDMGMSIKIAPMTTETVYNARTCFSYNGSSEYRITTQPILPDLTGFTLVASGSLYGKDCDVWKMKKVIGQKRNVYTMYVEQRTEVPVRYIMEGYDTLLGSHFDKYYLDYSDYVVGVISPEIFNIPPEIKKCGSFPGPGDVAEQQLEMNPAQQFIGSDEPHMTHMFNMFKKTHNKDYASKLEHERRKNIFRHNVRYVHSMNRANLTYSLKLNHLADLEDGEMRLMRGRRPSSGYNGGRPFNKAQYIDADIPDHLNWWLHGAVNPVKDQGVCGSCWSFGTTGAVEGAYFMKTGRLVRLSQQELMDCSWGEGNNACDGGEDFRAYQWIMRHGQATEADYGQYKGQDGYCNYKNVTPTAKMTGFVNVTSGDLEALRIAIAKQGPISVGMDASHKSLSFYANGVYYEPKCGRGIDQLDHSVLAIGYGTWKGQDYWLIRNSWSTYWGNDGYVLIARKDNNCGIATAATFVVM
ncbi:Counting factor associated protein D [Lamellibrachia satsuma]|nr:Counting factor associated protein D [Lamellibrachia satsuma]